MRLRNFPFILNILKIFFMNGCWSLSKVFLCQLIWSYDHIFLLWLVDMMYYIAWLSDIESALRMWNKSHVAMGYIAVHSVYTYILLVLLLWRTLTYSLHLFNLLTVYIPQRSLFTRRLQSTRRWIPGSEWATVLNPRPPLAQPHVCSLEGKPSLLQQHHPQTSYFAGIFSLGYEGAFFCKAKALISSKKGIGIALRVSAC